MSEFKVRRSAGNPRNLDVGGILPSGHAFTLTVSPWSGSRCTDVPRISAGFDIEPLTLEGASDAEFDAEIDRTQEMADALDAKLSPLADTVVERGGTDEAAVRRVVRMGLGLAFGQEVTPDAVDAAIAADDADFRRRREDHDRPIAQAVWEEAQEYEQGLRF